MLAPIPMIGAILALLLVVNISAVQVLSQAPHPDMSFKVDGEAVVAILGEEQWQVARMHDGRRSITLVPRDFLEEPDIVATRTELQEFFARQRTITEILFSPEAQLVAQSGESIPITIHDEPIPGRLNFWVQLFVGNIGLLVGAAVLAFQRSNIGARHLFVTGLGLSLSASAAAIYSARPLSLYGDVFQILSTLNHLGVVIFCCGFVCMMWNYPKPLANRVIAPFWYLLLFSVFALDHSRVVDSLDLTRRIPPVATLLLAFGLLYLQWRRSADDPLTRQSLKWFVFVTLSGSTFFALFILVPPMFGLDLVVSQGAAFVAFLSIYVGLAVGVARYPLFDLQQYWMKSLIWLGGALLVIAANLSLVSLLGLSGQTALWMLLASLALVAVPLKAAGAQYFLNTASRNFQHHLPQIVDRMARSEVADLEDIWSSQIHEIFQPLAMKREPVSVVKPTVVKKGLGLVVPMLDTGESLHLEYAEDGTRLFNTLDVTLLETLISLFELSRSRQSAADQARQEERGRLRKDIHDTLGGRLLTIMHSAPDEKVATESQQAMGELRDILSAVDGDSARLSEVLTQWQQQLLNQTQAFAAQLNWSIDESVFERDWLLTGKDRLNLGRILREGVTNGLRHARADRLSVSFGWHDDALVVVIANNGKISDPTSWELGYGVENIKERAAALNGTADWRKEGDWLKLELQVPTRDWAKPTPQAA